MTARPAVLVTLGETMAALSSPGIGPLRHQPHLHLHVGGAESNVAIAVTRLGGSAAWVGRVGDDELGDLVIAQLRGEGVDVRHAVRDPGAPTGLMVKSRRTPSVGRVAYYRAGSAGAGSHPRTCRSNCCVPRVRCTSPGSRRRCRRPRGPRRSPRSRRPVARACRSAST